MKKIILLLALVLMSTTSYADKDADRLIESCKQLANMYENRLDLNLLHGLTLSPSDTLMAGYCKGMLESFIFYRSVVLERCGRGYNQYCEKRLCRESDWYKVARKIALIDTEKDMNDDSVFDIEDVVLVGCR